jgi:hypothetical protein
MNRFAFASLLLPCALAAQSPPAPTVGPARGAFAAADGKRGAFVRVPERRATVIILTDDGAADARAMADRVLEHLLDDQR